MNFDALESFRVFAETLNFTHAASQRHLTQPALHKQVRNLSDELGVELYAKKGRSIYLTSAGIKVARFARETHERLSRLHGEVRGDRDDLPITLSAGRGSCLYLLGPAIRAFERKCPGILQIQVDDSAHTIAAVRSGAAHFGVTVLVSEPDDLTITPIQKVTPHLVVDTKHPLSKRSYVTTKDLDGLALILPPDPSPVREMIRAHLTRDDMAFNPAMEAVGWELAMHFVSLRLGATVVNGCCHPPSGTRAIPLKGFPITTYCLVEHPTGYTRRQTAELRNCVLKTTQRADSLGF